MMLRVMAIALMLTTSAIAMDGAPWLPVMGAGLITPPTAGLVSHWDMSYSGSTLYDIVGDNDGTLYNSPAFNAAYGVRDDGVWLQESSVQYFRANGLQNDFDPDSGTISMWVTIADFADTSAALFSWRYSDWFEAYYNGSDILFRYGDGSNYITTPGDISDYFSEDEYAHLAFVWDNSGSGYKAIYINGSVAVDATGTWTSGSASSANYYFGYLVAVFAWDGYMDEIRLYDSPLDGSDINTLYIYDEP